MKKLLAFVSGSSPAIITEKIYALATSATPWIPDEIKIFTTAHGKKKVMDSLINSGIYVQMCAELQIQQCLSEEDIANL